MRCGERVRSNLPRLSRSSSSDMPLSSTPTEFAAVRPSAVQRRCILYSLSAEARRDGGTETLSSEHSGAAPLVNPPPAPRGTEASLSEHGQHAHASAPRRTILIRSSDVPRLAPELIEDCASAVESPQIPQARRDGITEIEMRDRDIKPRPAPGPPTRWAVARTTHTAQLFQQADFDLYLQYHARATPPA